MDNVEEEKQERNQVGHVSNDVLVSKTIPEFLEHIRVEERRLANTLERYGYLLERWLREMGDGPVTGITLERVWIYKRKLTDAGLSPATIGGALSVLRSLFRYLREVRRLPVIDAEKIRRPKIPLRQVEYLTKDEIQRFIDAIPMERLTGLRDRALVQVLCSTGMRISEVIALNRDQVDWQKGEAVIVGKGRRQRKVYFTETAIDWLVRYLKYRYDDDPALFISDGGRPRRLEGQSTWRRFRRYARRAGLSKKVYPHMLRHTMATTLLANGCPIGHIRVLLGHAHLSTTCRYYLGMMSDAEVKVAHAKYLSYEVAKGQQTDEKSPGQENVN